MWTAVAAAAIVAEQALVDADPEGLEATAATAVSHFARWHPWKVEDGEV